MRKVLRMIASGKAGRHWASLSASLSVPSGVRSFLGRRSQEPFAAAAVSAHRLGWRYLGGLRFKADDGEHIDVAGCAPQYDKLGVRKSVRTWRDARINEQLYGINIGPKGLVTKGVNQAA